MKFKELQEKCPWCWKFIIWADDYKKCRPIPMRSSKLQDCNYKNCPVWSFFKLLDSEK